MEKRSYVLIFFLTYYLLVFPINRIKTFWGGFVIGEKKVNTNY